MSKIELRRTLYIGLGGTGMNAILHTKKMFMETYGEIPPMIGFLGIDTDGNAYGETLDSKVGEIRLDKNEQKPILVQNPRNFVTNPHNKEMLTWLHRSVERGVNTLDKGAGQIRSNGRLAVVINAPTIVNAIESAVDKIRHHGTITSDKYALNISSKDDIHLIFSLCGGTGCGTFIDIAYLIKNIAGKDSINLVGYAVLPDVFTTMVRTGTAMSKVKPNAFGAIQDLDYLMHLDISSNEIEFKYSGKTIRTNEIPFSAVHVIDNKNESNITYEHINQLTEMIALTLFISSGKIADKVASVNDNVEKTISEGTLDVGNKRAWVSSIGACEIVFNGYDLANIYAHKAAIRIIDRMFDSSCDDANNIANNWIDSPGINIRENNGNDNLINQILDKEPKFPLGDIEPEQIATDIQTYYNQVIPDDRKINPILEKIIATVKAGLHDLVIKLINKEECNIAITLFVLEDILKQIQIFVGEMTEEVETLRAHLPVLENEVKVGIENLQHWYKKSWIVPGRGNHMDNAKEDITEAVHKVVVAQIEIKRRDSANKVYAALKQTISDEYERVNNIRNTLDKVRQTLSQEIIDKQNNVEKCATIFEIDLSKGEKIEINNQSIIIKEFINSLPSKNLYELGDSQVAYKDLLNYTKKLPEAECLRTKTIDGVLKDYTDAEFKELIRIATEKVKPLLKINGRGHTVANGKVLEQGINKYYYVGLPDVASSRFTKDNAFKNLQPADIDINFISTGRNDKIILYRQEGVIPAFAINPLESYKYDYEHCTTFTGFDTNLFDKMQDEGFDLLPKAKADDDIEYWVKGFIFGFIKYSERKYWYQDWKNGKALTDYWVSTNESTRDKAYEKFKRVLPSICKQYTDKIEEKINQQGKTATENMIGKVRANYFDEFAQCEVNKDTITKRGYEKIASLMEKELQYINNKLSASL
jgi:hypothetical protein